MNKDVAARLAHSMGRHDEEPNILLAEDLTNQADSVGISEVAKIAASGTTAAQNDAIKVLYEIGARNPDLLRPHTQLFLEKMHSRNNRMVWGVLTALAEVCKADPKFVADNLESILSAADAGSVIAKDQAIQILVTLLSRKQFAAEAATELLVRLQTAAVNQLPMYAERISATLPHEFHPKLQDVLSGRLSDAIPESKRRRIEAVIKRLQ